MHKLCREQLAWVPSVTLATDGDITSDTLDLLRAFGEELAPFWQAEQLEPEIWPDHVQPLPRLAPCEIREAALKFLVSTACAAEGFHPRQLGTMSDPALWVLSLLFAFIEVVGAPPR